MLEDRADEDGGNRDCANYAGVQGGGGASPSYTSPLSSRRADPSSPLQTCVECSAFLPLNISEVFFFAQNAVLHPTAPLYDTRLHALKPLCVSALSRVFRLIDTDKDGLLSAEELNDFQRLVYGAPLQARELEGVKEVVEMMTEGAGLEGEERGEVGEVGEEGAKVNEEGWLALHTYFVQKGRLETTWKALRCFGYGEDLSLREEFLYPRFVPSFPFSPLFPLPTPTSSEPQLRHPRRHNLRALPPRLRLLHGPLRVFRPRSGRRSLPV